MTTGQETRITSETGGEKGTKLARFDLLPWGILAELAEHFGRGARKYEDRNWERGYKWSLSFAALHRHLEAFWSREDIDDDPNLYVPGETHVVRHIIAVVWHACCLAYFSRYSVGEDDRPHRPTGRCQWCGVSEGALHRTGCHQLHLDAIREYQRDVDGDPRFGTGLDR
jgi:Domain of unknown function (DUF5664)